MTLKHHFMRPGRVVWAVLFFNTVETIEQFETEDEAVQRANELVSNGGLFAHVYSMTYINSMEAAPRVVNKRF